jgi:molecular chaperone GrpE
MSQEEKEDAITRIKVRRSADDQPLATEAPSATSTQGTESMPAGEGISEEVDWREAYMRLAAEIDNTKKRLARNAERHLERERAEVLASMLPVADNLERILAHSRQVEERDLTRGLEIALQDLTARLRKNGVEPFEAEGAPFDPEWHEAIGAISERNVPSGTVVKVEQKGYRLDGKLLRPARVLVAR